MRQILGSYNLGKKVWQVSRTSQKTMRSTESSKRCVAAEREREEALRRGQAPALPAVQPQEGGQLPAAPGAAISQPLGIPAMPAGANNLSPTPETLSSLYTSIFELKTYHL